MKPGKTITFTEQRIVARTEVMEFDFQLLRQLDFNLRALGLDIPEESVSLRQRAEIGMLRCEDYFLELEIMIGSLSVMARMFDNHYQLARSFDSINSKIRKIQQLVCETHEQFWRQYRSLTPLEFV